jgi:alkylation response protein AidB-like acyl-CoA dehydrogenase
MARCGRDEAHGGIAMNLDYTAEQSRFRDHVRSFLEHNLPDDLRERSFNSEQRIAEDMRRWQRILYAQGWGAPSWPTEFGGTGWSPIERYLFDLECALAGAPPQLPFGLKMVAPVLMRFGSHEQQQAFLPPILSGEHWWCQGYSEPGAGSDLASLKTQAVRDGDHYRVSGQKAWNTLGQHADWIFCLVRTDPAAKPQRGISFLLIDMKSPGIRVRPTTLLDGTQEVNEIFFDQVRVPTAHRVGEENQGWTYAKYLLSHERANIAGVGASRRQLRRLRAIAAAERRGGVALLEDPAFRARLAQLEIELMAFEITTLRVLAADESHAVPGPEASILKIKGSEILQGISELMLDAIGLRALPFAAAEQAAALRAADSAHTQGVTAQYLNFRKLSIYGGSNEIQKNIIAHMILGF